MKVKLALVVFICLGAAVAGAQTAADLKRLRTQIAEQEKELQSLSGSKSDLARQISAMQRKQTAERRAVTLLSKQVSDNNAAIKQLQGREKELAAKQKLYEKQAAQGMAFIVDNSGTYIARAVMSGSDSAKIAGVMEIVGMLNTGLAASIRMYAEAAAAAAKVRRSLDAANIEIEKDMAESKALAESYVKTQGELSTKLTLIKHDENAQKEYLKMLKQEQDRITGALKESAKKPAPADRGIFAGLKGKLPYPMRGRITEAFGEKPVEGTKLTIMHKGVKIAPTGNGAVSCVAGGTVVYVDNINGMENIIIVRHDQDYYTVYANLDEFYVQNTDKVEKGTQLGRINIDFKGNPSYLYFEIRRHEEAVNPVIWFSEIMN